MKKILVLIVMLLVSSNMFAQTSLADVTPRDHKITIAKANEYTARYDVLNEATESNPVEFHFDFEQVKSFVNEVNGKWFTVKKGLDENGTENIVLTVLDAGAVPVGTYALQASYPCPPYCD